MTETEKELQGATDSVSNEESMNQEDLSEKIIEKSGAHEAIFPDFSSMMDGRVTELEVKLKDALAQVLYVQAESENIRRRATEDIEKARKYALEKFAMELLSVKDSLDAALDVKQATVEDYRNGVELTCKQLSSVFEKFNIQEIAGVGEKFDPNRHQAISTVIDEGEINMIHAVLQRGYKLNERVLRPALVTVTQSALVKT